MSEAKVNIDAQEFSKVLKKYKKLKKYMKSNIFEIHRVNGTEEIISKLTEEIDDSQFLRTTDEYEGRNNSSISGGSESSFIPCNNESSPSS